MNYKDERASGTGDAITMEILSKDELKRLQEIRNIFELPLEMRLPITIQVNTELGSELGIKEPIPPGFYRLKIEVLDRKKIKLCYYQRIMSNVTSIFDILIEYTESDDYEQAIRSKVNLMYDYLDKSFADLSTVEQYLAWVFDEKKTETGVFDTDSGSDYLLLT